MKKTINISLAGTSFTLEEDAYHKLDGYLTNVRRHFSSYPDVDEIVQDIEARFAEQFASKAGTDKVITLSEVEALISAMGSPEQFDAGSEKPGSAPEQSTNILGKKLYRNGDDVIIAGVASGVAAYFGIDAVWIRLLFVLISLANGVGVILYLVLWIILPEAKTETERMQMRGEPVNLKNLEATVKERAEEFKKAHATTSSSFKQAAEGSGSALRSFFRGFGRVVVKLVSILVKVVGFVVTLGATIAIAGLVLAIGTILLNGDSPYVSFPLQELAHSALYYAGIGSVFFVALVPLVFLVLLGTSLIGHRSSFTKGPVIALLVLFVGSGVVLANAGIKLAPQVENIIRTHPDFQTITKDVDVRDFNQVVLHGANSAEIKQGENFAVVVGGRARDVADMRAEVENGVLTLDRYDRTRICLFCYSDDLHFTITMPKLEGIKVTGASRLEAEGFTSETLQVVLVGASQAELSGTSKTVNANLSGASILWLSGNIDDLWLKSSGASRTNADNELVVRNVNAHLSGASKLYLPDVERLQTELSGASRVYYRSAKDIQNKESGASELYPGWQPEAPAAPVGQEFN